VSPTGILSKIKSLSFHYLWLRAQSFGGTSLVKWSRITFPKKLGGWGVKNIFLFALSLAKVEACGDSLRTTPSGMSCKIKIPSRDGY
jgi:hypothetical protein